MDLRENEKIITYNFSEDFIENLAQYLIGNLPGNNFERICIVFGGRRPALFLKRVLAAKLKSSFIPPQFFSINEFVQYLVSGTDIVDKISELEACFAVYTLAKKNVPDVLKARQTFSEFLPWAREIVSFIDQLDLENIPQERLSNIEKNAEIGYEVPQAVNKLLEHLVILRGLYHDMMIKDGRYSRGLLYLMAARKCADVALSEFDKILFCNFFDLHKTERQIIKNYYDKDKAVLFFQKDSRAWQQFDELSRYFGSRIEPQKQDAGDAKINLYAGFDTHSQVGIVREILGSMNKKDKENTVIVLPQTEIIIPLLSEISSCVDEFNVSMGYPVSRSTLYNLFEAISRAQKTRKKNEYYTRDYLSVIMHPLLKNLAISSEAAITRVLVHKIEEILTGLQKSDIGGSLFIKLDSILRLDELYELISRQLKAMPISVSTDELKTILKTLHKYAFSNWENISTLGQFSQMLEEFLDVLLEKSMLDTYPMNLKIIKAIFAVSNEFRTKTLGEEKFSQLEIFKIFDDFLKKEKIAFSGTPLKGLQILGLFETRALTFNNVIIMDVNESFLPRLSVNEPLVPRAVLISLGLDRLEVEEAIQRYQFLRLIKSAKNVHLVYNDSPQMQKSRFIEEMIWDEEKRTGMINRQSVRRAVFNCDVMTRQGRIEKNKSIMQLFDNFTFSASSLNVYLKCPMQFYYKYILGLNEKEDLLDKLESKEVGNFIHKLLEDAFIKFVKKAPKIDSVFKKQFFAEFDERFNKEFNRRMKSDAFMIKQIMRYRLERFLDNEAENPNRRVESIEGLEKDIMTEIKLRKRKVKFKCRIDRIDRLSSGRIQVIDYKTGSSDAVPGTLKSLQNALISPERKTIKKALKSFQLPLYLYCVEKEFEASIISAALYNLRTLKIEEFPRPKEYAFKEEIMDCSLEMLDFIVEEIYDINIPFEADENEDSCRYCSFVGACR